MYGVNGPVPDPYSRTARAESSSSHSTMACERCSELGRTAPICDGCRRNCSRKLEEVPRMSRGKSYRSLWCEKEIGNLETARFLHWKPDRKSTRLNSSHSQISYAVFCLEKK